MARLKSFQMSVPKMRIAPRNGRTSLGIINRLVLLPAPFGPKNPDILPGSTASDNPSTAWIRPNRFETFSKTKAACASLIAHPPFAKEKGQSPASPNFQSQGRKAHRHSYPQCPDTHPLAIQTSAAASPETKSRQPC